MCFSVAAVKYWLCSQYRRLFLKNKKFVFLLDNSFRESYCFSNNKNSEQQVYQNWDKVISILEAKIPGFSEGDYRIVEIPLCAFESVGLRPLCPEGGENFKTCFPEIKNLVIPGKYFDQSSTMVVQLLDEQIGNTFKKLLQFYYNTLDPQAMISKFEEKIRQKLHPHAESLRVYLISCKEDLVKNGKNGWFFQQLCRDLAWDSLVKHTWGDDLERKALLKESGGVVVCDTNELVTGDISVLIDERYIIKRLIAYYYKNKQEHDYLAGAVLFKKYAQDGKFDGYPLRQKMDPYLTEYAFVGFCDEKSDERKPVIVITCDYDHKIKKNIQRKRMQKYNEGRRKFDTGLMEQDLGKLPFVAGYICVLTPCKDGGAGDFVDLIDIAFDCDVK